jgi:UDP-N-acetylglucosamine transferase subunit ALG13
VPDFESKNNLSGALSHHISLKTAIHYIKPLSQFKTPCKTTNFDYKYIAILSGIEPERSILERKLILLFKKQTFKTLLIQGKIATEQVTNQKGNLRIVNYLIQADLEKAICKSETVICRSGYTSIMDLQKLQKKAFFIPTPEQTEQEYLAKYLEKQQITPFAKQAAFSLTALEKLQNYKGFGNDYYTINWKELFKIFD